MFSVWNDPAAKPNLLFHEKGADAGKKREHFLVVGKFPFPVVHIKDGIRQRSVTAYEHLPSARRGPEGGRKSGGAGKDLIVHQKRVQAHHAAHGAAGDEGVPAVAQRAEPLVNIGL